MELSNLAITFVHYGNSLHPAHQGFADAIDADTIHCGRNAPLDNPLGEFIGGLRGFPNQYDLLIAEGTRPLIALAGSGLVDETRVVYLASDGGLYKLNQGIQGRDSVYEYVKLAGGRYASTAINTLLASTVDGVIGVSEFATELIYKYLGDGIPYRTAYPYIQPDVYRELETVQPELTTPTAVTIGQSGIYKNIDCLVEAWPEVRDAHPEAQLRIVGRGHPAWYDEIDGVERLGYVANLREPLSSASLYVHPASIEVFGVAVVEAMLAGVPPIITNRTGAKEAVERMSSRAIVEPTEHALAEAVAEYFTTLPHDSASTQAREIARGYTETKQKSIFRKKLKEIVISEN